MQGQRDSNLAIPGILILVAVAWGILVSPVSLDSPRPVRPFEWSSFEAVPARLWEDPLQSVGRAREKKLVKERNNLGDLRTQLQNGSARTLVLTVLIPGAPYAEQQERRMRMRYAILSALGIMHFPPSHSDSISYFKSCLSRDGTPESSCEQVCDGVQLIIPYEWLLHEDLNGESPGFDRVLLLWVDEERLGKNPLQGLHQVLHGQLLATGAAPENVTFRIIGPSSSTLLYRYAVTGRGQPSQDNPSCPKLCSCPLYRIKILSPWSTLDLPEVSHRHAKGQPFNLDFHRVIGTDQQLLQLIARELELRNAGPRKDGPLVVLISEWDTIYGRFMQETFRNAYEEVCSEDSSQDECKSRLQSVRQVFYLRGVDGKTALLPTERSADRALNREAQSEAAAVERAEGPSQRDYLRRLPRQLRRLESSRGHIRAIGVLGTDIYDKLLILKALRQEFPDAVFFTTDLGWRLLHPNELGWSRNLIVASHFSLGLGDDPAQPDGGSGKTLEQNVYQKVGEYSEAVLRFRDSYQTASLLAALLAVLPENELEPLLHPKSAASALLPSHPRVYEIGRQSPVLLNPAQPHAASQGQTWTVAFFSFALAAVGLAVLSKPATGKQEHRSAGTTSDEAPPIGDVLRVAWRRMREAASAAAQYLWPILATFFVLTGIAFFDSNRSNGEPWTLFEGVSIWPTDFLLAAVLLISWEALRSMRLKLNQVTQEIDREIFRHQPTGGNTSGGLRALGRAFVKRFTSRKEKENPHRNVPQDQPFHILWKQFRRDMLRELMRIRFQRKNGGGQHQQAPAQRMWGNYKDRTASPAQAARLFLYLFPVTVLCLVQLMNVPARAYRGWVSWGVDEVLLTLSTFAIYLVIVYVLDLSIMTSLFTDRLSLMESQWPAQTIARFAGDGDKGRQGEASASTEGEGQPNPLDSLEAGKENCADAGNARGNKTEELLSEWLDIQLISRLTRTTEKFIYYPFAVSLLFALAHHSIFDRWVIGGKELIQLIIALTAACVPPILIRRTAEKARQLARERIQQRLMRVRSAEGRSTRVELLEQCLRDVAAVSRGAFSPITRNPILHALLIPFGSYGGLAILEYLAQ